MCEGKDFIQLIFHDNSYGNFKTGSADAELNASFQNPKGDNSPLSTDHLYNSYFSNNQTINGTNYCFTSAILILKYQTFLVIALMG